MGTIHKCDRHFLQIFRSPLPLCLHISYISQHESYGIYRLSFISEFTLLKRSWQKLCASVLQDYVKSGNRQNKNALNYKMILIFITQLHNSFCVCVCGMSHASLTFIQFDRFLLRNYEVVEVDAVEEMILSTHLQSLNDPPLTQVVLSMVCP